MPSKPIELPPEVAKAFVRDMRAFHAEKSSIKRDEHDVLLSPIAKLNLHALAIDERRLDFKASVWRQSKFRVSNSVMEQVWFPGEHADVGGGFFSDLERNRGPRRLDDVTLDWMIKRILHHYPDFPILDHAFAPLAGPGPNRSPLQHNSRLGKYKLSPAAIRSIGNIPSPLLRREQLVTQNRNESVVGESIHISALVGGPRAVTSLCLWPSVGAIGHSARLPSPKRYGLK
jgi:T6SS, Phospholipase effector Tle1-like, catalytic domain